MPKDLPPEATSAQAIRAIYETLKLDLSWGRYVEQLADTGHKPGFSIGYGKFFSIWMIEMPVVAKPRRWIRGQSMYVNWLWNEDMH